MRRGYCYLPSFGEVRGLSYPNWWVGKSIPLCKLELQVLETILSWSTLSCIHPVCLNWYFLTSRAVAFELLTTHIFIIQYQNYNGFYNGFYIAFSREETSHHNLRLFQNVVCREWEFVPSFGGKFRREFCILLLQNFQSNKSLPLIFSISGKSAKKNLLA